MPPKNTKGGGAKLKPKDEQREDTLQAVVLADSFETRFKPFTLERPRCLLPLANTPLIEYTLEFLANAGVQDIFLYCGSHTEQIEDYINKSKWKLSSSPFDTLTMLKTPATSVGDAMRDLDKRDLITGDFILVNGDLVSNLPIQPALAKHRARRGRDRNAIMTMILREAGIQHRTKRRGRKPVFIVDPEKERCLHYEEIGGRTEGGRYMNLDPDLLSQYGEIEIREDLIDCNIDICTPDVLSLWSDNFDYQSVRKSFLFGVLKDYELNGKTIHTHIVSEGYAARVRSLRAYDSVSRDIMGRWTYPLCPDSNLLQGQKYRLGKGKVYKEEGVTLARSSMVKSRTVIGSQTCVGEGSLVEDSIIGRRCRIGKDVTIQGSYIWDDVTIGDGSLIKQAIVANESTLGKNCTIDRSALIPYNVQIPDNSTIISTTKFTPTTDKTDDDTSTIRRLSSTSVSTPDLDSSTSSLASPIYTHPSLAVSTSSISTLASTSTNPSLSSQDPHSPSRRASTSSIRDFYLEATSSILDAMTTSQAASTIILELTGLRMANDASQHEVRRALASALVTHISNTISSQNKSAANASTQVLAKYAELIARTIFDKETQLKPDQVDWLNCVERECVGKGNLLVFVVKECWDAEVVEEEGVFEWWGDGRQGEGWNLVQAFVERLSVVESESEEESEED